MENKVTILEDVMEKCRHFSNGNCTGTKDSTICYIGCPLHQKERCKTTNILSPDCRNTISSTNTAKYKKVESLKII